MRKSRLYRRKRKRKPKDAPATPAEKHRTSGRKPEVGPSEQGSTGAVKTVAYDSGPDVDRLRQEYQVDITDQSDARTVQRLESKYGSDRVSRWANEGVPLAAMGKPRDIRAHRAAATGESSTGESSTGESSTGESSTGESSRGESFPHERTIERSLGVDIPGEAEVNPAKAQEQNAPAVTDDTTTYFDSPEPDLEVAAHEAAHQAQHSGQTRDANLGPEGHAGAVARRVTAGRSARDLVGPTGSSVRAEARPYTEVRDGFHEYRVAESTMMIVRQDNQLQHFYADPSMIDESNDILESQNSVIRLHEQSDSLELSPRGMDDFEELPRVLPENVANATEGENMNIWADCGKAARDVIGAGEGSGWGPTAGLFGGGRTTNASGPEAMKKEILNEEFGMRGDRGLQHFQSLPEHEQDQIAERLGIDEYATPETGQAYTISTGGERYEGVRTWNFHFAGVVMDDSSDHVVLENYAVGDADVENTDWDYQMYGPPDKEGQTFHEQHKAMEMHGKAPTTMVVVRAR